MVLAVKSAKVLLNLATFNLKDLAFRSGEKFGFKHGLWNEHSRGKKLNSGIDNDGEN